MASMKSLAAIGSCLLAGLLCSRALRLELGSGAFRSCLLCLQFHLFLASMGLVLLADDAYAFMVAWETMALSSYFLVTTRHQIPEIRRAGFLYLLMAHVGALGILLAFGVLQGGSWQFTFDAMRAAHLSPQWATVAFLLALFGFGTKAGLVPLHVWLPEAHPAAPSPVSALMSGVMLKTAVYGVLRVTFDLLGSPQWWWGLVALALGLFSAFYGVLFAAVQTDMKRLLAWSSIENIGLIFTGFGITIVFHGVGLETLAALSLVAMLYHCLNHAFMKSLLFLGTGAVLHATGERNLGKLGGLIRYMPWVAWLTLVGALTASGLPPLAGFVSEWLLLQTFLFTTNLPTSFLNMLVPLVAAAVALVAALSGYAMVKFFGVIFLGQPREDKLRHAHDGSTFERIGLAWLATGCIALGLFPVQVITAIDRVTRLLVEFGLAETVHANGWLLLAPTSVQRASYSPIIFLLVVAASIAFTAIAVRILYHGRQRRVPAWDCGYPDQTARMQDTAEGFGQPIRQIFEPVFRIRRHLPRAADAQPRYEVSVGDHFWYWLYEPVARVVERTAAVIGLLQRGRIAVYLLYSFLTLITVLIWAIR